MQTSTPPMRRHQQSSKMLLNPYCQFVEISSSRASLLKRVLPILEGNAGFL